MLQSGSLGWPVPVTHCYQSHPLLALSTAICMLVFTIMPNFWTLPPPFGLRAVLTLGFSAWLDYRSEGYTRSSCLLEHTPDQACLWLWRMGASGKEWVIIVPFLTRQIPRQAQGSRSQGISELYVTARSKPTPHPSLTLSSSSRLW